MNVTPRSARGVLDRTMMLGFGGLLCFMINACAHSSPLSRSDGGGYNLDTSNSSAQPTARKSIRQWVTGDGVADDSSGVARAFAAARHHAFTLVVDCPVRIEVGDDIGNTIFIDDGTKVEFAGNGKFIVDNILHPAFVIANSRDITLTNWNVEYDAILPVDWDVHGYKNLGQYSERKGYAQPAMAFNDVMLTHWLNANRGVTFHGVNSIWVGPTNSASIFFLSGDTSDVHVAGMRLYVPKSAGGDRFIPMAFSLTQNYKSNQTVTRETPRTGQFIEIPHDLSFTDIDLDGTYMGWQGGARNVRFQRIRSHRYGDLQDSNGQNVGGVGKWFAPPHLFYLNFSPDGDPMLFTRGIDIDDVVDDGPRIGATRDKPGEKPSGYALSLKLGCYDCRVNGYKTNRPDGFMDVLPSNQLSVSNVDASFDSTYLNGLYPGWRFPSAGYANLTFENIALKDMAPASSQLPISNIGAPSNEGIVFRNVQVTVNRWAGAGLPVPTIAGQHNDVSLDFTIVESSSRMAVAEKGSVQVTLQASPSSTNQNGNVLLVWTSKGADRCAASGSWAGDLAATGTRTIRPNDRDISIFAIECQGANGAAAATLRFDTRS